MTANITTLSGLRGANLAAFEQAASIVDQAMRPRFDPRAESLLRQVRALLGYALNAEPIDAETAKAFGARAANKLQLSLHMSERQAK